jgi:ectoine hydroxylase-related dioxygenase (phytanoyl-CoA dioxygenase family)
MMILNANKDSGWLSKALAALECEGYVMVEGVIADSVLRQVRSAMYRTRDSILAEIGEDRLRRAGELGVLRIPMKYDPVFFRLLELPAVLSIVDATVSSSAILHLQNGFILPSFPPGDTPKLFQNSFHQDFPRYLNGYMASINTFFAIDRFTRENGATFLVRGSHQKSVRPADTYLDAAAEPSECAAGSMLLFDSTLWHAAGTNVSGTDRLAINQQFTRSWIKQQIDYVRTLGDEEIRRQPPRTQQLLGYYTRVVTSLDEYYRPEAERLYRKGQG